MMGEKSRITLNFWTKEEFDKELMKGLKFLQTGKKLTSTQVKGKLIKELNLKI